LNKRESAKVDMAMQKYPEYISEDQIFRRSREITSAFLKNNTIIPHLYLQTKFPITAKVCIFTSC